MHVTSFKTSFKRIALALPLGLTLSLPRPALAETLADASRAGLSKIGFISSPEDR